MYKYDPRNKILKYFKGMCCSDNNKLHVQIQKIPPPLPDTILDPCMNLESQYRNYYLNKNSGKSNV